MIWLSVNRNCFIFRISLLWKFYLRSLRFNGGITISPDGRDGSLRIQQDTHVYAGLFDGDESATLALDKNRHAYVHVARGSVELDGVKLDAGDGVRLHNPQTLQLTAGKNAEVLVFDLRPRELPQMP